MTCIAINQELLVKTCPLAKGQCYWQHRVTQQCCYTKDDLEICEFAVLVGAALPTEEEVSQITANLKAILKT